MHGHTLALRGFHYEPGDKVAMAVRLGVEARAFARAVEYDAPLLTRGVDGRP